MNGEITTNYGTVVIDNKVIAKVAGLAAVECAGIIGMAAVSRRDGLVKLLTRNSLARGIKVKFEEGELVLDLHVIVSYGVSIAAVTDNLFSNVKYPVEKLTGFKLRRMNVFVDGVRVID